MPEKESIVVQCARFSLYAPVAGILLNCLSNSQRARDRTELLVIGFASYAIYTLGLILGIVALARMRPEDKKAAQWRAIVGVCVNGVLVVIFTVVIFLLKH
jgi:hypothetical protein